MGEALGRLLIYVRLKNELKSDLEAAGEIERGRASGGSGGMCSII